MSDVYDIAMVSLQIIHDYREIYKLEIIYSIGIDE